MKSLMIAGMLLIAMTIFSDSADAGWRHGFGPRCGVRVYAPAVCVYAPPVAYYGVPEYYPAPRYCAPAPVYYGRAYCAPRYSHRHYCR